MEYMEKLRSGTQLVKTELCFNIIDFKKKGYFTEEDLETLIRSVTGTGGGQESSSPADEKVGNT